MKKIRLSDTDLELFDIEIGPSDYLFYQRHKDAFKTMFREQGKPFWTRFQITFRSFTVKHGIIKQMNIDSPRFQNLLDQAFIFIHEHFVDAKDSTARNFIDDVAKLAQNQDKFSGLDSKSFAKDPFFQRNTRELFRNFFGPPDQKSSYLKVYILCPVYLRFGGSVCRCLVRWMEADPMDDPNDDSYWTPPQPNVVEKFHDEDIEIAMCDLCSDACGTRFFQEKIFGNTSGPRFLEFWTLGDPRFYDPDNPLFAPHLNPEDDWREVLSVEKFKDFYNFARFKYGSPEDKCKECHRLKKKRDKFIHMCKMNKKKKKQDSKEKEELIKDLKEVRSRIDELDDEDFRGNYEEHIQTILKERPRILEAIEEAERKDKLEQLQKEQAKAEEEKAKAFRKNKKKANPEKKDAEKITEHKNVDGKTKESKEKNNRNDKDSEVNASINSETSSRESSVEKELDRDEDKRNNLEEAKKNSSVKTYAEDQLNGSWKHSTFDENDTEENGTSGDGEDSSGNGPFRKETTKSDHAHYSFSDKEVTPNKNIVSGFKVIKIEDADNGLYEVNVSAACVKSDEDENTRLANLKEKLKSQELNNFILSANLLREKIYGLPKKLEWWEGRGFAVAVVNYEEEEIEFTKKWTNFTLKINGYDENAIKQTLIQLLVYVSKRKRRICNGWNMEVDDIVACVLPEESPAIEDLSISICRGFRFEDRLTEFEKESLLKHYPNLCLDKVLCGIEKGAAVKTLEKKGGREKLRKIIDLVADKEILAKDLPSVDVEKLKKKLNNKEEITKADILWEQLIRKPDTFEIFVLLEKDLVMEADDWWKLGMRSMDIRHYNNTKNPDKKICPVCKTTGMDCSCEKPIEIAPKVVEFVESSNFENIKVLGDEDGPSIPNMKYTETNLNMDKNDRSEKKSKSAKSGKKKEKMIELSDLPAKFIEAGLDAKKTKISIPTKAEEPMMGKVPIPVSDKLERLAPVPGVQSSLNFTFQNGKKEQKITVTLGAYMQEEKINEIQEKKELLKLLEEEEKRKMSKAVGPPVKKEKKEKKREKSKSKSPQKPVTSTEADEDGATKKEKTADIATQFLKEVFGDEEKLKIVSKALHQQMGLSNKKKTENKSSQAEKRSSDASASDCACPHHDQIQWMKKQSASMTSSERQETLNDLTEHLMDILDQKKTSKQYRHLNMPFFSNIENRDGEDKKRAESGEGLENEARRKGNDKRNGSEVRGKDIEKNGTEKSADKIKEMGKGNSRTGRKKKANNPEVDSADVDKIPDEGFKAAEKAKGEKCDNSSDEKENLQEGNLRLCGNCEKMEPARKAFKKCQRCKDEGVLDVRYYCSRECQVEDWKKKHKMEHKDGLLG